MIWHTTACFVIKNISATPKDSIVRHARPIAVIIVWVRFRINSLQDVVKNANKVISCNYPTKVGKCIFVMVAWKSSIDNISTAQIMATLYASNAQQTIHLILWVELSRHVRKDRWSKWVLSIAMRRSKKISKISMRKDITMVTIQLSKKHRISKNSIYLTSIRGFEKDLIIKIK